MAGPLRQVTSLIGVTPGDSSYLAIPPVIPHDSAMPPPARERAKPKPLDATRLRDLAIHYVSRYSTTSGKLTDYVKRKLRERGWSGEAPPDVAALVGEFAGLGYVDDAGYARSKAAALVRRGYGPNRVKAALLQSRVSADLAAETSHQDDEVQRESAIAYARRKRIGPYSQQVADRAQAMKWYAQMSRAGHRHDIIRAVLSAVPDWEDPE
jgi:regulatory protein